MRFSIPKNGVGEGVGDAKVLRLNILLGSEEQDAVEEDHWIIQG